MNDELLMMNFELGIEQSGVRNQKSALRSQMGEVGLLIVYC